MGGKIFSFVVPTHNEKDNIVVLIPEIITAFKSFEIEIIVVDDASFDGTREAVENLKSQYPFINLVKRPFLQGIGSALIEGYNLATGTFIISCDADLSFPIEDIVALSKKLLSGNYDIVLGSRYMRGSFYEALGFATMKKKLLSKAGNIFLRVINHIPVHDFSANCRGMKQKAWGRLNLKSKNNFMLFEMIYAAHSMGMKITEVPVRFYDRRMGLSKLRLGKEVLRSVKQLLLLKFSYDYAQRGKK